MCGFVPPMLVVPPRSIKDTDMFAVAENLLFICQGKIRPIEMKYIK
jgi:hypothetical protein